MDLKHKLRSTCLVPQDMLQKYRDLVELEKERKELRLEIIAAINARHEIEPGELTAITTQFCFRRYSKYRIQQIVSPELFKKIERQIPEEDWIRLLVRKAD